MNSILEQNNIQLRKGCLNDALEIKTKLIEAQKELTKNQKEAITKKNKIADNSSKQHIIETSNDNKMVNNIDNRIEEHRGLSNPFENIHINNYPSVQAREKTEVKNVVSEIIQQKLDTQEFKEWFQNDKHLNVLNEIELNIENNNLDWFAKRSPLEMDFYTNVIKGLGQESLYFIMGLLLNRQFKMLSSFIGTKRNTQLGILVAYMLVRCMAASQGERGLALNTAKLLIPLVAGLCMVEPHGLGKKVKNILEFGKTHKYAIFGGISLLLLVKEAISYFKEKAFKKENPNALPKRNTKDITHKIKSVMLKKHASNCLGSEDSKDLICDDLIGKLESNTQKSWNKKKYIKYLTTCKKYFVYKNYPAFKSNTNVLDATTFKAIVKEVVLPVISPQKQLSKKK